MVIIVIVVAALGYIAYHQYQDKKAWAMVGGRRSPKFGPSTDYCEGYYGDDRPRRRGLNEVEPRQRSTLSNQFYFQVPGDYYDSIELGEEGDMDYTYDDYV